MCVSLRKLGVEDHQFRNVRSTLQQIHTLKADSLSTVSLERQFHPQLVCETPNTVGPVAGGEAEAFQHLDGTDSPASPQHRLMFITYTQGGIRYLQMSCHLEPGAAMDLNILGAIAPFIVLVDAIGMDS